MESLAKLLPDGYDVYAIGTQENGSETLLWGSHTK